MQHKQLTVALLIALGATAAATTMAQSVTIPQGNNPGNGTIGLSGGEVNIPGFGNGGGGTVTNGVTVVQGGQSINGVGANGATSTFQGATNAGGVGGGVGGTAVPDGNTVTGADGGAGVSNTGTNNSGGGGGGGGGGLFLNGGTNITHSGLVVTGGNGGNGGNSSLVSGVGGGGGAGAIINGGTLTNASGASIAGGIGGLTGSSAAYTANNGAGGDGVVVMGGATFTNEAGATVTGGAGLDNATNHALGSRGGDAVRISGDNGTVINAGTIQAGQSFYADPKNSGTIAPVNAVDISGNNTTFEIWSTSQIKDAQGNAGKVVAAATSNNATFALGGDTAGTLDASTMGSQYVGFANLEKTGTSEWTLTGAPAASAAATPWTIEQGTLAISDGASLGTGATTLNGGTMETTAATTIGNNLALGSGGGTVESTGNTTISGIVSGAGALTKTGTGSLTLTGSNTYTGAITITGGTVLVNGDQTAATGATSVASGATLGGTGTIGGDVAVADGATLAPGSGGPGTLKINGSLNLSPNAISAFEFGQAYTVGGNLNGLVSVGGNLILDGTLNVSQSPGGSFGPGVYRVYDYAGALTDNGLALGALPSGTDPSKVLVQTSIANQVNLVNATGVTLNFWDGTGSAHKNNGVVDGGDGLWQTPAGNDNWTEASGSLNTPYNDNAFAIFEGTAGKVSVDNSLGDVKFSGAQFATDGYVIGGDALTTDTADTVIRVGDGTAAGAADTATINSVIGGSGGIEKADLGTLILGGANTYAGGTTVSGGALQVSADDNLGAAGTGVTLNGGTLQYGAGFDSARAVTLGTAGGTIDTNGNDAGLSAAIGGSGSLTKVGPGRLLLTADASYGGGTTISGGTLQLGNGGTAGWISGNVLDNGTLSFDRSDDKQFDGVISGTGSVDKESANRLTLTGGNTYSGGTALNGGTLVVGNAGALGTGTLAMAAGTTLDFADSYRVGNAITLSGDPTVNVNAGLSDLLAGSISDGSSAGTLEKTGSGTLLLGGSNTYSGQTLVTAGTLQAGGANTFSANSAHTVSAGAVLDTAGYNQSVAALNNAGTVSLRSGTVGSTLIVNGNYVGQGGTLDLGVNLLRGVADELVVNGSNASASGSTQIALTRVGGIGAPILGNGIEVVSALNGATTTAQTSKNAFSLEGGVLQAGAYQYKLYAGDAAGAGENWYLRTSYRPGVSVNAALPSLAQQLTRLGTLHERVGDNQDQDSRDRAWVLTYGRTGDHEAGDFDGGGSSYSYNTSGIQAGVDLYNDMSKVGSGSNNAGNQVGIYLSSANGNGRVNTTDNLSEAGSISGQAYSLGGYWTHYFPGGIYLDAVAQATKYRDMSGRASDGGNLDTSGSGYAASLEAGFPVALTGQLSLEPEAQLMGSYVDIRDGSDSIGHTSFGSGTQWTARLGTRLVYAISPRSTIAGNFDVLHAFGDSTQATFSTLDGSYPATVSASPRMTWSQLGVGLTAQASKNLSAYMGMDIEVPMGGDRGERSIGARVGVKYSW